MGARFSLARRSGAAFVGAGLTLATLMASPAPVHATGGPLLTVGDVTVVEGDSGTVVVSVPVDLSVASAVKVTVPFSISGGDATAGADYRSASGVVSFAPGVVSRLVTATVYPDTTTESNETFNVALGVPANATIDDGTGVVTIEDDDVNGVSTTPEVNIGSVEISEADGGKHTARIPVTLSQPAPTTIKVKFGMACSTAALSSDISMPSGGTITFNAGQQSKWITFSVVADVTGEDIEELIQTLSVALGNALMNQADGGVTILDNDGLPPIGTIERVSVASEGAAGLVGGSCGGRGGTYGVTDASISDDGRYEVFVADFTDLVPADTNGLADVFVRDRMMNTTERVNVDSSGAQALPLPHLPLGVQWAEMSGSGRVVAWFQNGYFPDQSTGYFVRDLDTGVTQPMSAYNAGALHFGRVYSINTDGRYVLVEGSTGGPTDTYWLDRQTGASVKVLDGTNSYVEITADGQSFFFTSTDGTLVPGDTNNCIDGFVRNLNTGATVRMTLTDDEQQLGMSVCNSATLGAFAFARGGTALVFASWDTALGACGAYPSCERLFVRDIVAGTTERVDQVPLQGFAVSPSIDASGRRVSYAFQELAPTGGVYGSINGFTLVGTYAYTYERLTGVTDRNGVRPDGIAANNQVLMPLLSGNGRFVAYVSRASNLTPKDTNGQLDLFVERLN